ncbi:MAG: hypothetical protein ACE5HQ_07465 [Gemmatimonadota bacterium]
MRPRFFATSLDAAGRRVYGGITLWFLFVFFALIWPVYPLFSGDRPRILGVPHSLAYVVALLALAFLALGWLYAWEDRRGALDADAEREPAAPCDADREPWAAPDVTRDADARAVPGTSTGRPPG